MKSIGIRIRSTIFLILLLMCGCDLDGPDVQPLTNTLKLLDHPEYLTTDHVTLDSISGYADIFGDYRYTLFAGDRKEITFKAISPKGGTIRFSYGPGTNAASFAGDVTIRLYISNAEEEKLLGRWEMARSTLIETRTWQEASVRWPDVFSNFVILRFEIEGFSDDAPAEAFYIANPRIVPDRALGDIKRIVIIGITALRADHLGCYGYERDTTPAIDEIAERGILYDNFYSDFSTTSESIQSIINQRILENLRVEKFTTFSIQHNFAFSEESVVYPGFDSSRLMLHKDSIDVLEEAYDWISSHVEEDSFAFIHLAETGLPYVPPLRYRGRFDPGYEGEYKHFYTEHAYEWGGLLDYPEDVRGHLIALYDEEVAATDASIGWFIDSLESDGLLENSLIIITGLCGEELWEHGGLGHGHSMNDEQLHVPFIIFGPGINAGERIPTRTTLETGTIETLVDLYMGPWME